MRRVEAFCESCDSEFSIELVDTEIVVKYCPVCGAELDQDDLIDFDQDPMEEDWED
jgi:Zn finger protein HypA/HybF involved in hydrogenase expression